MIVLDERQYRVFGSPTFRGNPVSLFEVDALDDSSALQLAARHSGTTDNVFFVKGDCGPVKARFFSSTAELWLCGHGLLALSHHLCPSDAIGTRPVYSPSGSWRIHSDSLGPGVLMPALRGVEITDSAHWMQGALRSIGLPHEGLYQCPNDVWVVLLRQKADLLNIDAGTIAALPSDGNPVGALIAALPLAGARYGFRYFAPWHGKPEDSGTGSAHCYLAPLLAGTQGPVTALQYSPEGVAEMPVRLRGDRVAMSGLVEPCSGDEDTTNTGAADERNVGPSDVDLGAITLRNQPGTGRSMRRY